MTIKQGIKRYENAGLEDVDAIAKACQDIILFKIANSNFSKNITVKGGVVLMNISKDNRRATQDLDLDFIRYSIDNEAINAFIDKLNNVDDDIKIEITGKIKSLNQDDYKGKRVFVLLSDDNKESYKIKLDLGVHVNLDLKQEELYFDLGSSKGSVTLLANSKEQIVTEKLKSFLKNGELTTRLKDVYDIYYLTNVKKIDKDKFRSLIADYILKDYKLKVKTYDALHNKLNNIFSDRIFLKRLESKEDDWLELPVDKVVNGVLDFFEELIS